MQSRYNAPQRGALLCFAVAALYICPWHFWHPARLAKACDIFSLRSEIFVKIYVDDRGARGWGYAEHVLRLCNKAERWAFYAKTNCILRYCLIHLLT